MVGRLRTKARMTLCWNQVIGLERRLRVGEDENEGNVRNVLFFPSIWFLVMEYLLLLVSLQSEVLSRPYSHHNN